MLKYCINICILSYYRFLNLAEKGIGGKRKSAVLAETNCAQVVGSELLN